MNNIIFFWKSEGKYGFLSNWSDHPIRDDDGIYYHTIEHYIMYQKAKLMNDEESAREILHSVHPFQAKTIGRSIKNFNGREWDQRRRDIAIRGLTLKVAQHPSVRRGLINTKDMILAKASPHDATWGIGMVNTDIRALDPKRWLGKNLLGRAWMDVRAAEDSD